ncbi:MAG: low molecular weight phosphotyrosine protein phosphatase [Propionibacteriaceae bacterium]|nr:low molecular weight phosphotyrosine protein phosphatase [Propionibacteriaceae bacterium]
MPVPPPTSHRDQVHIVFVCWGNICRSIMAERIARAMAHDADMDAITFTSAAISTEETGHDIDLRAAKVLRAHGYDAGRHRAHQITTAEIAKADLVVVMEPFHRQILAGRFPAAKNIVLMTDFDPSLAPGTAIDDPWSGPDSGFDGTRALLEQAMPGLLEWCAEALA